MKELEKNPNILRASERSNFYVGHVANGKSIGVFETEHPIPVQWATSINKTVSLILATYYIRINYISVPLPVNPFPNDPL